MKASIILLDPFLSLDLHYVNWLKFGDTILD